MFVFLCETVSCDFHLLQETSKEAEGLKTQVADLRDKVRNLRDELEEREVNHKEKEENLRKTITALEVSEIKISPLISSSS